MDLLQSSPKSSISETIMTLPYWKNIKHDIEGFMQHCGPIIADAL